MNPSPKRGPRFSASSANRSAPPTTIGISSAITRAVGRPAYSRLRNFARGWGGLWITAVCFVSLALILLADLLSPRNVSPGALSVVPVAVAAAVLSPRLIAVVVVAGLAARLAAAIPGQVSVVSAIAEMSTMLVIALVGRDAAVNFAMAEQGALHDPLTGLPNRRLFMDRLENTIRQAERQRASACVLILDLNGFKAINDSLGHQGGDKLLELVTQALLARLRESDTLARLGGDEFAVLLAGYGGLSHGVGAAERVGRALSDPFSIGGRPVQVQASVGIAVYPECGADAVALMSSADQAMYVAKRSGQPYEVGQQTEPST